LVKQASHGIKRFISCKQLHKNVCVYVYTATVHGILLAYKYRLYNIYKNNKKRERKEKKKITRVIAWTALYTYQLTAIECNKMTVEKTSPSFNNNK